MHNASHFKPVAMPFPFPHFIQGHLYSTSKGGAPRTGPHTSHVLYYPLLNVILDKLQTFIIQSTGSCKLDSYRSCSCWNRSGWYGWVLKEVFYLQTRQSDLGIKCPTPHSRDTGSVPPSRLHSSTLWGKERNSVTLDPKPSSLLHTYSFTHLNCDGRWYIWQKKRNLKCHKNTWGR